MFHEGGGCSELEPFALRVTDDSMEPEFMEGCVIVIEPALQAESGNYVIAEYAGETWFRKLEKRDDKVFLTSDNDRYGDMELIGQFQIRGIIIAQNYKRKRKKYI